MDDGILFCQDCHDDLNHDEIRTVADVPHLDIDSFEMERETVDVYQCDDCGMILGYDR